VPGVTLAQRQRHAFLVPRKSTRSCPLSAHLQNDTPLFRTVTTSLRTAYPAQKACLDGGREEAGNVKRRRWTWIPMLVDAYTQARERYNREPRPDLPTPVPHTHNAAPTEVTHKAAHRSPRTPVRRVTRTRRSVPKSATTAQALPYRRLIRELRATRTQLRRLAALQDELQLMKARLEARLPPLQPDADTAGNHGQVEPETVHPSAQAPDR